MLLDDRVAREEEPSMMIIGCDFHPSFQQIAYVNQETGEYGERRLNHRDEAVRRLWDWKRRATIVGSASW